jgi:hypothetical protein
MTPLVRGFWVVSQIAALPLAVFCWFATLYWVAVAWYHGVETGDGLGWSWQDWRDVGMFGAFGPVFWIGLRFGRRMSPRWAWLPAALPLPWLAGFLAGQFDEEPAMPGDGMLPASVQGGTVTVYLALLLALVSTHLILAVAEAFRPERPDEVPG